LIRENHHRTIEIAGDDADPVADAKSGGHGAEIADAQRDEFADK
jgi:hypothetical protein